MQSPLWVIISGRPSEGLDALDIDWDLGANADLTTAKLTDALAQRSRTGPTIVGRKQGEKPAQGRTIEALYELPLLAHATMEPLNTTVHVTADKCEIWVGTQVPVRCVEVAAKVTGLAKSKIVVNGHYLGGGFGRRLETDSVEQAVKFAKQVSYPLKVIWTREEDIRHDIMRPMYYDRISAVLDSDGRPLWYGDHITARRCSRAGYRRPWARTEWMMISSNARPTSLTTFRAHTSIGRAMIRAGGHAHRLVARRRLDP